MFEPVRGGTRGGQAEFKWSDVSADKDRENYLGHSVNAPTGRWQKNKDVHWYNRDKKTDEEERLEEIRKVKELEAEAIAAALGYEPATTSGDATGSNAIAVPQSSAIESVDAEARRKEKEAKRRRKEEKKEEKRAKKESKRHGHSGAHGVDELEERSRRRSSRSRSPIHRLKDREEKWRPRSRSRSPSRIEPRPPKDYDAIEREKERENDRRRWELNARREQPLDRRRY